MLVVFLYVLLFLTFGNTTVRMRRLELWMDFARGLVYNQCYFDHHSDSHSGTGHTRQRSDDARNDRGTGAHRLWNRFLFGDGVVRLVVSARRVRRRFSGKDSDANEEPCQNSKQKQKRSCRL